MVKEEEKEEALVAAIDVKELHRRVGHLGKVGMERLASEGLVRGLEGGVAGEMEMFEGCELSRPRPHPHRPVDLSHRSTRPLELVHADPGWTHSSKILGELEIYVRTRG